MKTLAIMLPVIPKASGRHLLFGIFLICLKLRMCTTCTFFDTANVTHLLVRGQFRATLNFSVGYENTCDGNDTTTVKTVELAEITPWVTLCKFAHENGSCFPSVAKLTTTKCSCSPDTGLYTYRSAPILRTGNQTWMLLGKTTSGEEFNKTVMLIILEPPAVSRLIIKSEGKVINKTSPAARNTTVSISCLWGEGNPPQTATLKKDDVQLKTTPTHGRIEHVIHNVECDDTGMISCEAAASTENKTQMLNVKCEPEFDAWEISFLASSDLRTVNFPVMAHDRKIVACVLLKNDSSSETYGPEKVDCVRIASLNGSVPNLNLTIQLPLWVKKEGGRWRLDFTNYGGKGSVYFTIPLAEIRDEGSHSPDLTAVIVLTFLVVVVAIVIISVCHYKTSRKGEKIGFCHKRVERRNRHNRVAVSQSFYRRSNVSVMITNDLYEGCDTTRTPVELDYTDVHDAIQQPRDGTPGTTSIDTRDNITASVAFDVTARAGVTELGDIDEDNEDGDYEEISLRQPVVPPGGQPSRQQMPQTTLGPPKPCHSSEVAGDYADVE